MQMIRNVPMCYKQARNSSVLPMVTISLFPAKPLMFQIFDPHLILYTCKGRVAYNLLYTERSFYRLKGLGLPNDKAKFATGKNGEALVKRLRKRQNDEMLVDNA